MTSSLKIALPVVLPVVLTASVHAEPVRRYAVEVGAGAGVTVGGDYGDVGPRTVERIAFGIDLTPYRGDVAVMVRVPLELAESSFQPPGNARVSNGSLALPPELGVLFALTRSRSLLLGPVVGLGAAVVGDDNSCINTSTCDAYNQEVGLKLVMRGAIELDYRHARFVAWLRPVEIERFQLGVGQTHVSALAGVGLAL